MASHFRIVGLIRGLCGGAIGGGVGYYLFSWILQQDFYAIILPGAAVGFGFGFCSGERSKSYGILCAVLGVALGLFAEWRFFPFVKDESFRFFITHVHEVKPISLIMIGVGGLLSYSLGMGRGASGKREQTEPSD